MTPDWQELELEPKLIYALLEQGLQKPTLIQQRVIPVAMDGSDVLATAPTGTGKTLAYVLPVLQHLLDYPRPNPGQARALVLCPTRELAEQTARVCQQLAEPLGLTSLCITGGVNYGSHLEHLRKNLDIIVATPGRLIDYLNSEDFVAEDLEVLVLDEVDRLLDMGFRGSVERVLDEARHLQQRLLFSATADSRTFTQFSQLTLEAPQVITAEPPRREKGKIHQWLHLADNRPHKEQLLTHLLQQSTGRVLVFVRKRDTIAQLLHHLTVQKFPVASLTGDLSQSERQKRVAAFHSGSVRMLLATDVASRGLDIPEVAMVINFDLPRTGDTYVHRIGRTGRAGRKGVAVSLVEAHDMALLGRIERYLEQKVERRIIEGLRPATRFPDPHKQPKKKKKKKQGAGRKAASKSRQGPAKKSPGKKPPKRP